MPSNRREFLHYLGLAFVSAALSGCLPKREERTPVQGAAVPSPSPGIPTPVVDHSRRRRLRDCWMRLGDRYTLRPYTFHTPAVEPTPSCRSAEQCIAEHDAILAEMVEDGELQQAVADELQAAFRAATDDANWPAPESWTPQAEPIIITCYFSTDPVYPRIVRRKKPPELIRQVQLLADMTAGGNFSQETIDQAFAAIARDIAFLSLSETEQKAVSEHEIRVPLLHDSIIPGPEGWLAPRAVQAARFLVGIFLEP